MSRLTTRAGMAALLALLLAGTAAGGCQQDGGLVVSVITDLPPSELASIRLLVRRDGETQSSIDWPLSGDGAVTLPGTFYLFTPRFDSPIEITLEGYLVDDDSDRPSILRTSTVNLVSGQNLYLRMALERACIDRPCSEQPDSTCIDGQCAPRAVPEDALTEYREGEESLIECGAGFVATSTGQPLEGEGCGASQHCVEGRCLAGPSDGGGGEPDTDAGQDPGVDADLPLDLPVDLPGDPPTPDLVTCTPVPDFDSDPVNCGACGQDCLGGACVRGQCQPVVVASGLNYPFGNVVCGDFLFHIEHDGSKLGRIPLDGTGSTTLAEPCFPHGVACDDRFVYYDSECSGEVFSVDAAGATPPTSLTSLDTPNAMAFRPGATAGDGASLFVIALNLAATGPVPPELVRIPLPDGANPVPGPVYPVDETVMPYDEARGAIAFSETELFLEVSGSRTIRRYPIADPGSPGTVAASTGCRIAGMAVYGDHLFWLESDACGSPGRGTLWRSSLSADEQVMVAAGISAPSSLAVDDTGVYFTSFSAGAVLKVPLEGGEPLVLASDQAGPASLVLSPKSLFWSNEGTGEIVRLVRP